MILHTPCRGDTPEVQSSSTIGVRYKRKDPENGTRSVKYSLRTKGDLIGKNGTRTSYVQFVRESSKSSSGIIKEESPCETKTPPSSITLTD